MLKKAGKLQGELFKVHLSQIVNKAHPLCRLAESINVSAPVIAAPVATPLRLGPGCPAVREF